MIVLYGGLKLSEKKTWSNMVQPTSRTKVDAGQVVTIC